MAPRNSKSSSSAVKVSTAAVASASPSDSSGPPTSLSSSSASAAPVPTPDIQGLPESSVSMQSAASDDSHNNSGNSGATLNASPMEKRIESNDLSGSPANNAPSEEAVSRVSANKNVAANRLGVFVAKLKDDPYFLGLPEHGFGDLVKWVPDVNTRSFVAVPKSDDEGALDPAEFCMIAEPSLTYYMMSSISQLFALSL
ncbi:hypothetical protein FRC03_006866, partial [Tulasnella sp. 419]